MYQCCYLRFECLHNQFYVILYVILIILFGGGGRALIGISPRASKWLETALLTSYAIRTQNRRWIACDSERDIA